MPHHSLINQSVLKQYVERESNKKKVQALRALLKQFPSIGNPYSSDEIARIIRLQALKYK